MNFVAARVIARQLDRRFERFGAGIAEIDVLRFFAGRDRRQTFRKFDHSLVIKIGAGHVDQLGRLLLDGCDDARVAVPRGDHGDARGEIQKHVAVDVLDHRAAARFRHQGIAARIGRRNGRVVALNNLLWPWGRQLVISCGNFISAVCMVPSRAHFVRWSFRVDRYSGRVPGTASGERC